MYVAPVSLAGIRNPTQQETHALQQTASLYGAEFSAHRFNYMAADPHARE
jgi:hypothetical protein